jgi:SAM-dependent methyltransferase
MANENWPYFENRRDEMLQFVPFSAHRILDVGCGKGTFARALKEARLAEVWGIEIDPVAAASAAIHLDRVETGEVNDVVGRLAEAFFDCVVFNDILEHLAQPAETLGRVRRILAPGAVVVASIPNVRYIGNLYELVVRGDWKYTSSGILDHGHLRFYTRRSLPRLFGSAGYDLERIEGINGTTRAVFPLVVLLSAGALADTKWMQFACVARPRPL